MFHLLLPQDFFPEDWGWQAVDVYVPHQVHTGAMRELRTFGFVSTQWSRWEPPFAFPAVLATVGYDPRRRQFRALYNPPLGTPPEEIPRVALRERYGYSGDLARLADVSG